MGNTGGWGEYDLDEIELGERAAEWLTLEELGSAYSRVSDRVWSATAGCFAKIAQAMREKYGPDALTGPGARAVPPEWTPQLDEHGMWHMPPDKASA